MSQNYPMYQQYPTMYEQYPPFAPEKKGLSGGAIFGIVFLVLAIVAGVIVGTLYGLGILGGKSNSSTNAPTVSANGGSTSTTTTTKENPNQIKIGDLIGFSSVGDDGY